MEKLILGRIFIQSLTLLSFAAGLSDDELFNAWLTPDRDWPDQDVGPSNRVLMCGPNGCNDQLGNTRRKRFEIMLKQAKRFEEPEDSMKRRGLKRSNDSRNRKGLKRSKDSKKSNGFSDNYNSKNLMKQ